MHPSTNTVATIDPAIVARIENLERQNRRLRRLGGGLLALACIGVIAGFQGAPKRRISADEMSCGIITAETFSVSTDKGTITLDKNGLTIAATGGPTNGRTALVDHESRIEIGLDWEWAQENALRPTPRIAVGRAGNDASDNLLTRITLLSPEGCHSGEWHTNNPKHDGRTDKDWIDSLRRN